MKGNPEIEALNQEFNAPDSTMRVEVYTARLEEIRARPPKKFESDPAPVVATVAPAPAAAPYAIEDDPTPVTRKFLMLVLGPLMKSIAEATKADNAKVREDLEALYALIKVLEDRPQALAYAGVWSAGQEAQKSFFYTDRGSIWFCRESTQERPGTSACWQLACKAGRDGKDAQ